MLSHKTRRGLVLIAAVILALILLRVLEVSLVVVLELGIVRVLVLPGFIFELSVRAARSRASPVAEPATPSSARPCGTVVVEEEGPVCPGIALTPLLLAVQVVVLNLELRAAGNAEGALVFANYFSEGAHRVRVGKLENIVIDLLEHQFVVRQIEQE